jgi:hypothetical protein
MIASAEQTHCPGIHCVHLRATGLTPRCASASQGTVRYGRGEEQRQILYRQVSAAVSDGEPGTAENGIERRVVSF